MIAGTDRGAWLGLDSEGMLQATAGVADHIEQAMAATGEIAAAIKAAPRSPRSVVVLGIGGSGVAGAVAQAFGASRSPVPVVAVGGYEAPAFADESCLVFAVSFSGATEETIECATRCMDAGARVVAVTTGGPLADAVVSRGGSVIGVGSGLPQPRAGVGAMTARLLLACEEAGVMPGARGELELAVGQLRRRLPELVAGGGVAEETARRIGRTVPLFHGASGLGAVAARRWRTQVNENAKSLAFDGTQPEVCHNEVCGLEGGSGPLGQLVTLVELRMAFETEVVAMRFDLLRELVGEGVKDVIKVRAEGEGELAGFFDLVAIGDTVSLHLAAGRGVDPGPVPVLAEIKRRLAAR